MMMIAISTLFGNLAGIWIFLPALLIIILAISVAIFRLNLAQKLFVGHNYFKNKIKLKTGLIILATLCLALAFLDPQWGEQEQLVPQTGRNIIIALDVSKSMLAQDLKPNRLEFAKNKIKKLIPTLAGEQVGLILFAGQAVVMCPLTRDRDLLLTFLEQVDTQTISSGTTNLAEAIIMATKMLQQTDLNNTNLLAVFTDGEDFSQDIKQAGSLAKKANLQIFTFGVATLQGAPIPDVDLDGKVTGFIKNKSGQPVISCLNQDLLKQVAAQCGGSSVLVDIQKDNDLEQLSKWVLQFETNHFNNRQILIKNPKYYYFAGLALFFLLLEWVL